MSIKENLYILIEKKRQQILDMQMEMHTLLITYHSLPSENVLENNEEREREYREIVNMKDPLDISQIILNEKE